MTIALPDLDDLSYASLLKRMVESIPKYSRLWTDYNDSDPGITLLQLLCWIAESLMYRANYIPIETYINFLQLLAGAAGDEIDNLLQQLQAQGLDQAYIDFLQFLQAIDPKTATVETLQTAALTFFNAPYLAVTAADYTTLTLEANRLLSPTQTKIARAIIFNQSETVIVICVANQTLILAQPIFPNYRYKFSLTKAQKTLINEIPPKHLFQDTDYAAIITAVQTYLAPRQLLGSITQVQKPVFTPVNIEITLICDALVDANLMSQTVSNRIESFLSPLLGGGLDGNGWIYNQTPTAQMISHEIVTIPGISYIKSLNINFYPTMTIGIMATLDVDAIVGDAPDGLTMPEFVGLPQIRILNVLIEKAS